MSWLFAGKIGSDSCLKITGDSSDNPWTTPDADVHKFRFNSNLQEFGYISKSVLFEFEEIALTPAMCGVYPNYNYIYYPAGSDSTNWLWRRGLMRLGTSTYYSIFEAHLGRLGFRKNRKKRSHVEVSHEPIEWRRNWLRTMINYPGSTDNSISSFRVIQQLPSGLGYLDSDRVDYDAVAADYVEPIPREFYRTNHGNINTVAARVPTVAIYEYDLPLMEEPYPVSTGTPSPGQEVMRLTSTMARMARSGFDVLTADPDECIFHEDKNPLKILLADYFEFDAGAEVSFTLPFACSPETPVEYQVNELGEGMFIPPIPRGATTNYEYAVGYKIVGDTLTFKNEGAGTIGVRFIVFAEDFLGESVGTADILEIGDGYFVIRKPGTAGTNLADVLIDSRFPTVPIVKQGWIPWADMVANTVKPKLSTHMKEVTWTNPGFKPFVIAFLTAKSKADPNVIRVQDFYMKSIEYAEYRYSVDSTFACQLTDTSATFFASQSTSRLEDGYRNPSPQLTYSAWDKVGIRYYILAVPDTL